MEWYDTLQAVRRLWRRGLEGRGMTQIIGAICGRGSTGIAVSDRMVSTMVHAYEPPMMKVKQVGSRAVVLVAGNPLVIEEVIAPVFDAVDSEESAGRNVPASEIGAKLSWSYSCARTRRIEEDVLARHAGVQNMLEWHEKQSNLDGGLVTWVNSLISQYRLGMSLVLVGISDHRAHVYAVSDDSRLDCYDAIGYQCDGIGSMHAHTTLARHGYHPGMDLRDAIYAVFEAKKSAEMAPGVGTATDILILANRGIERLKPSAIDALEHVFRKRLRRARGKGLSHDLGSMELETDSWVEWLDGTGSAGGEKVKE